MTCLPKMNIADNSSDWIQLHVLDNCVVAIRPLVAGSVLRLDNEREPVIVAEEIPAGHKVAITGIPNDQQVTKYGWPIGRATQKILAGSWIHSHNLRNDHRIDYQELLKFDNQITLGEAANWSFQGFHRANGKVGTRNYIAVISTVNCSASVARWSASKFSAEALAAYPNVDGVIALRHETGCGMAYEGAKHKMLERVLGGIAAHPNVGAAVLVGLGCEQATVGHLVTSNRLYQIDNLSKATNSDSHERYISLDIQSEGGTSRTISAIEAAVGRLLPVVNNAKRTVAPLAALNLGLKCGGSDGYSGITANPSLGYVSDLVVAAGGTTILGETTEVYGAEHLLMRRARTPEVAKKLEACLKWWEWYSGVFGEEIDHNPSTGNKAGGLTTIAEKSLGAVSKSGYSVLQDVIEYAAVPHGNGLYLMDSPGFDPACVTGMMASGANVVAFTTGRGSCFGSKPVPTLKITTNSKLYEHMPDDMDFDSGTILTGESMEANARRMLKQILEVASGAKTKSESLGYGDDEFIPWTVGAML